MKLAILSFAFLFVATAQADMIKPATLDLTCTSESNSKVIRITSNANGATVTVDGEEVLKRDQLIGGTEGGAPYLQAVGGGYNITIGGGDFEKAFYASETVEGQASANVNAYNTDENSEAVCSGTFSF